MGYCPLHPQFGFNTQPPEGGWGSSNQTEKETEMFQHTAARRRLDPIPTLYYLHLSVSTHSRPKAAGCYPSQFPYHQLVSTHSRPKAAGCYPSQFPYHQLVSTHSRPKAAGRFVRRGLLGCDVSTHSRPKAAGSRKPCSFGCCAFQHTAARRRLVGI